MKIARTITKEGLKTNGGAIIPSPFIYEGVTTGIDTNSHNVGFTGIFKADANEEQALTIKGTNPHPKRGLISNIGGTIEGACACSEDELVHTLDDTKVIAEVDKIIAARLGCELGDIS